MILIVKIFHIPLHDNRIGLRLSQNSTRGISKFYTGLGDVIRKFPLKVNDQKVKSITLKIS